MGDYGDWRRSYDIYIEVLSSQIAGPRERALTGEMIAIHAEINHLLARTKGRISGQAWGDASDRFMHAIGSYTSAWNHFVATQQTKPGRAGSSFELKESFQMAVNEALLAVIDLRNELLVLGEASWEYPSRAPE